MANFPPPHGSSPHRHDIRGTNRYGDFEDVVEEEDVPSQHRTRSQTARQSAHSVHAMPTANAVIHPTTGTNMEYPTWDRSAANEFGRLAQGVGRRIEGSNTIFFIPHSAVPRNKAVTYARFVIYVRPNKEKVHRVRLTVGGNLIK
jgi:hypothetical protein